jgi:hypothetical protein
MSVKKWALLAGLAIMMLLPAALAQATFIDLLDSAWSAGNNLPSYTRYLSELGASLRLSASGGQGVLSWDAIDGFGVAGGEQDEVDRLEVLTLEFSSPVYLSSFKLSDLFNEYGYLERGFYRLDGGAAVSFSADPGQLLDSTYGLKVISLGSVGPVSSIQFFALNPNPPGQNHDFSLAGLEVTGSAVPEPSSLALFASALMAGGVWRLGSRRRRS